MSGFLGPLCSVFLVLSYSASTFAHQLVLERGQIISGIHKESLPQPILYETFIPLILEYQTPKWNKSEVTFNNWYTCVSEKAPYRYSCAVVFPMNQAMLNLHVDFEGLHPVIDPEGHEALETSQSFYESLTTSSSFCDKIQKHFSGIWTKSTDLEQYIEALGNCHWESRTEAKLEPLFEMSIPDYNYSIRTPFTRMENNFYTTFYKDITRAENTTSNFSTGVGSASNLDLVASALLSNARTTIQGAILGVYYAEKNRWVHANQDCLNQVIPQSIVTQKKFKDALTGILNSKFFNSTYELSIDPSIISKYYTLPLTDCSHTSTNTFVVRILIPVSKKRRSESLELFHIHTLPFNYKDHVCKLKLGSRDGQGFFQNIPASGSHYLHQELSRTAIPTDCKPNELCKISEYGMSSSQHDLCMSALLTKNHTAIQDYCDFDCKKRARGDEQTPIVTRLHSNKYVLTGGSDGSSFNLIIRCKGEKDDVSVLTKSQIGSLMVTLPCNCELTLNNGLVFYGEGPCSNSIKLALTPIVPYHFGRVKSSKSKSSTSNTNAPPPGSDEFYYEDVSEDMLVNLADYVDIERIEGYLKNSREGVALYRPRSAGFATEETDRLKFEMGSGCSVTTLWTVFVITVVILLCIQMYILYLLRKIQGPSYPKDDRILYRVPDSPVMY